jgi:hypothetical protein
MEGVQDLLKLLCTDQWNGFGFQCDEKQERQPYRIYVAQLFEKKPDCEYETFDEASFLEKMRPKYSQDKVWMTDYLGHDFLTVSVDMFERIPEILNDCLNFGYRVLTHTCVKTVFTPGMVFDQRNFELELIHSVEENYRLIVGISEIQDTWGYLKKILNLGPLKREFNWVSPEGKAFCRKLRQNLKCKRPMTKCFNHFEKYRNVCERFGIFLDRLETKEETKRPKFSQEEEEDCIICMERPASTLVFPCECKVVCEECSEKLKRTPDVKTCAKCRREINMVVYVESNKIEEI